MGQLDREVKRLAELQDVRKDDPGEFGQRTSWRNPE